jgi:hypothetical protein
MRVAKAHREQKYPTLEQVKRIIHSMPAGSDIERCNRALIVFTILTGARDSAIASMKRRSRRISFQYDLPSGLRARWIVLLQPAQLTQESGTPC